MTGMEHEKASVDDGDANSLTTTVEAAPKLAKLVSKGHVDIQLPPNATTTTNTRVPTAYRTLSIHVYDSQRFTEQAFSPSPKNIRAAWWWPFRASSASSNEDDATFFSKLDFHLISPLEVVQRFNVSPTTGLDATAAAKRLQRNGPNILVRHKPHYWRKLLRYLFGDFCSILWVGVVVFFISWRPLGNPPAPYNLALAIVVIIVILLQATFSGFQDWSAQRVMASILDLVPEQAVVLRDGRLQSIPSRDLVVGDVVQLLMGQKVPADVRVIMASHDLKFDKAVLTGESEEVVGTVDSNEANILEAKNIAFLGSHVCNGSATAVVILTGARTVMGRINRLTNSNTEERTNLQREITRFVKIIILLTVSLVIVMLVTWLAWIRRDHYDFINTVGILTNLMSLIVAFIPEGMPIAVALTLTLIAKRMRDVDILPKSLSTVETLGCVSVVCSDKTGTLTENRMSVVAVGFVETQYDAASLPVTAAAQEIVKAMMLCNDATFSADVDNSSNIYEGTDFCKTKTEFPAKHSKVIGNATDAALLRYSFNRFPSMESSFTRVYDLPFNSTNKFALTYVENAIESDSQLLIKGAPDILLDRCASYMSEDGEIHPLKSSDKQRVVATQAAWANKGERVILIAMRNIHLNNEGYEESALAAATSLTVLGLVGILDPPRSDIPRTVSDIRRCGSRFFMVTGDFSITAVAIARKVGILSGQQADNLGDLPKRDVEYNALDLKDRMACMDRALVVEGKDFLNLTGEQWDVISRYQEIVFARTTPEQKLRIVTEFRNRGAVVAVTGDGVNDAPALKAADVGIALVSGSEVAMEAADLVLLGDFSSIVEGIRLGRLVLINLQKSISYLLPAGSWSEDWPVILNVFFGVPLPLSSFLMIIICCFTDLSSCLSLVFERAEHDLLSLPPRDPKRSHLVNFPIYLQSYLFIGVMETLTAHSMFFYYIYKAAGIPVKAMFFVFAEYSDGYYGHSQEQLDHFLCTGQCVYFVTLVILQIFNLNSVRNKKLSILQRGPQTNKWVFVFPLFSIAIAIFVTEVPGIQSLFGTASVPIKHWLLPIPLGLGILLMDELRKLAVRMFPRSIIAKLAW